ncbi:MAG: hypothetical protein JXR52_06670 [Bacteroidales bacterium]|nr:hypothetical protein [Bacteroidales bacterium]
MKNLTSLLLILCVTGANAASWRLNNNPAVDADFRTFADAHEAASPGDTIFIEGNGHVAHYGNISITKKLVLIGPGYFLNENDSTYAHQNFARFQSIYIQAGAQGTEVYGLYVYTDDANTCHMRIWASDVIVARNYFSSHIGYNEIYIAANVQNVTICQNFAYRVRIEGATASNLIIANNYISNSVSLNNSSNAIITNNVVGLVLDNVYNSEIKNNIILSQQYSDPVSAGNSSNSIAFNLLPGNLPAGNLGPGNIGNVNMSTVFAGYPEQGGHTSDSRFQLKPDGPAVGAGEGGTDCGMFGGSLPYVLSGLPAVPRIYEAVVPTAGSAVSGLPVIIKARSQN